MIVLAGVDAGGSHTEAAISTRAFRSIKRGRAGPGYVGPARIAIAAAEIEKALRKAFARTSYAHADVLAVGAAGAGDEGYRKQLAAALLEIKLANQVHVVTDAELALESAFPSGPGVLLVSGTGSIAVARDAKGVVHRVGGHGHQFGDEGSGYSLGRAAVQAVFRSLEGRGEDTIIKDLIFAEVGVTSPDAFSTWTRIADRRAVADLASIVQLAAQSGDPTARKIVTTAAWSLIDHVHALLPTLSPTAAPSLALAGGLLANQTPIRSEFVSILRRQSPRVQIVEERIDPVMGALMIAKRRLKDDSPA